MTGSNGLKEYTHKFQSLRVDRNRYTSGRAPNKAVLLLSLMLLHKEGKANLRDIRIDSYLLDTWGEHSIKQ